MCLSKERINTRFFLYFLIKYALVYMAFLLIINFDLYLRAFRRVKLFTIINTKEHFVAGR